MQFVFYVCVCFALGVFCVGLVYFVLVRLRRLVCCVCVSVVRFVLFVLCVLGVCTLFVLLGLC